jgi:hypothetical protein
MNPIVQRKVYVQQTWKPEALIADGFLPYRPVKQVTMARLLPPEEAPKTVTSFGKSIIAQAGYWITYAAGDAVRRTLDDYKPRPIKPAIFAEAYREWDEPKWHLTLPEAHLHQLGCRPFYKIASVWAKQLTHETWVQGIESFEPALAHIGSWLCVGMEGEPWIMTSVWFRIHYLLPGHKIQPGANNTL